MITVNGDYVLLNWDVSSVTTDYRIEYTTDIDEGSIEVAPAIGGCTS